MNILVLGGTGAIGEHLVNLLSDMNSIYVTSRKIRSDNGNIHYLHGNAHDKKFLVNILSLQHWDAIVDFMVYSTDEFQERIHEILDVTNQYLFLSTSRVYSNVEGYIKEDGPRLLDVCKDEVFLKTDDYALTKARQEDILRATNKTNWTIIRPYITFSEQRLQLGVFEKEYWLYRAIHGGAIIFSKDIAEKYTTLTYGKDVAKGMAALVGNKDALAQAFHITTDKIMRWSEVLDLYLEVLEERLGLSPKVLMLDDSQEISLTTGTAIWALKYDRLYNRRFDNSKFLKVVDDDFEFEDAEEKLKQCINEFIDKGCDFKEVYIPETAYMDRVAKERNMNWEIKKKKIK